MNINIELIKEEAAVSFLPMLVFNTEDQYLAFGWLIFYVCISIDKQ